MIGADIQLALYFRSEAGYLLGSRRMLQVIERAPVRDRAHKRCQLQRCQRNALAKGAHLAHAAELLIEFG